MAFLDGDSMALLDMVKQQLYFLDMVSTIFFGRLNKKIERPNGQQLHGTGISWQIPKVRNV